MIKVPEFIYYSKIYEDPKNAIEHYFKSMNDLAIQRLSKLPKEQLPHCEPRIRVLYFETYFLVSLAFHNASIVMCGVLLEAVLKDILYFKEKFDEEIEFYDAIEKCKKGGYITKEEASWLHDVRKRIRNLYVHARVGEVVKIAAKMAGIEGKVLDVGFRGWEFNLETGETTEKIFYGSELRPIDLLAKTKIDEQISLPLFLKVDEFTRAVCKRHFAN